MLVVRDKREEGLQDDFQNSAFHLYSAIYPIRIGCIGNRTVSGKGQNSEYCLGSNKQ